MTIEDIAKIIAETRDAARGIAARQSHDRPHDRHSDADLQEATLQQLETAIFRLALRDDTLQNLRDIRLLAQSLYDIARVRKHANFDRRQTLADAITEAAGLLGLPSSNATKASDSTEPRLESDEPQLESELTQELTPDLAPSCPQTVDKIGKSRALKP